ncbi:hypothetical protein [Massilia varians]|nr:hypothetical protein [Massilia varians]
MNANAKVIGLDIAKDVARVIWALMTHGRPYDPAWSKDTTRPA